MLKNASEMSVDELRAEVAKIEAQRAKRRAYSKAHRKVMSPELKAKLSAYNKQRRAHQRDVLARAAQEGVEAGAQAPSTPSEQPQEARPGKPSKRKR
jgi:hypothetical protein